MGFKYFEKKSNLIKFNTKIKYSSEDEISQNIVIPINISYTNEKELEVRYPNWTKNTDCIDLYCTYLCSEVITNNNISKIKFNDKDEKYKYKLSSLADVTKDISSEKDSEVENRKILDRNDISILDHASFSIKSGRHFVVKGDMDSEYVSDNIKLIVSKSTYGRELPCKGYKFSYYVYNYYLDCDTSTSSINADLQNAFAYLEDNNKGFIINFEKFTNSTATNSTYMLVFLNLYQIQVLYLHKFYLI